MKSNDLMYLLAIIMMMIIVLGQGNQFIKPVSSVGQLVTNQKSGSYNKFSCLIMVVAENLILCYR